MNNQPLVSIVIVTWNRRDDLLETIQSIYDQPYQPFEIVVADNGSTDGTVEAVRQRYPAVKWVLIGRNLGVSGGRNAGVTAASGSILFFLDSDASLPPQTLETVVRVFNERAEIGVVACRVLNAHTGELDPFGGKIFAERDAGIHERAFLSYAFSECGCAFRTSVFNAVDGFWNELRFGREGEEMALRVWGAGQQILYYPDAFVWHRASPNKRIDGAQRAAADLRSALTIYIVRYPLGMLLYVLPLKIASSLFKGLRKRQFSAMLAAISGVGRQLPTLLRQRTPMAAVAAQHYFALQRDHGPLSWNLQSWLRHKVLPHDPPPVNHGRA